jgi:hypothetical protein
MAAFLREGLGGGAGVDGTNRDKRRETEAKVKTKAFLFFFDDGDLSFFLGLGEYFLRKGQGEERVQGT